MDSLSPSVDQFAEVLSQESQWYDLGVFLGTSNSDLKEIDQTYATRNGTRRCLIELYGCLEKKGKPLSWETIAIALRRIGNNYLADKIHSNYILPFVRRSSSVSITKEEESSTEQHQHQPVAGIDRPPSDNHVKASNHVASLAIKDSRVEEISGEFQSLTERFVLLTLKIKRSLKASTDIEDSQDLIEGLCGLAPLPESQATFEAVFNRLKQHCSILNFRVLVVLVESLLTNEENLQKELAKFTVSVESFKKSAKMIELVRLINENQIVSHGDKKRVKLKVREFWNQFTMKQFETVMNEILGTLYDQLSHITVGKGCICVSWVIPDHINASKLVPELSFEFVQIIGVISLHIGDTVIYDIGGEGCETIEAAMLQAIELKRMRAIELLLAVGCSPEVATYHENNVSVTTIVNIRDKPSDGNGVHHVCVLGHNEHIEAIVDPIREPEYSPCRATEETVKGLQQEIVDRPILQHKEEEGLRTQMGQLKSDTRIEMNTGIRARRGVGIDKPLSPGGATVRSSIMGIGGDLRLAKMGQFGSGVRILDSRFKMVGTDSGLGMDSGSGIDSGLVSQLQKVNGTAVSPRPRLGIGAEMKVKVTVRDRSGTILANGGSAVRAILACNGEECLVTDNDDGTYLVSVIPQKLGQHQFSISVNGHYIWDRPYTLDIVPQRDYTILKHPVQSIDGISSPKHIAFSDNGDMFVTSTGDHCIYVYDESGNKKATFAQSGGLQFCNPYGIDINGEVVYVAEYSGHRIHILTTEGEFIGRFGEKGSGKGQLHHPTDVKISPDGKVYVADSRNNRVQVFNPADWTVSHIIDVWVSSDGSFFRPRGVAFDLSGDVHVTSHYSSSVTVFTPNGQFVREYEIHAIGSEGIAVDPSGYSTITTQHIADSVDSLSVYDPKNGKHVHSVTGLFNPSGVSVSPDGSLWVADTGNNRLVQY